MTGEESENLVRDLRQHAQDLAARCGGPLAGHRPEDFLAGQAAAEIERLTWLVESLVPFLAIWAEQYAREHHLDGMSPSHYDLLKAAGARMDDFRRATEPPPPRTTRPGPRPRPTTGR
jgi:hypothetical protein